MATKVLAFLNQKGGVAKTTLTAAIAYSMANTYDKKVLVIDWDMQASLSYNVGAPVGDFSTPESLGIADLFKDYILDDMPFNITPEQIKEVIYSPTFFKSQKQFDEKRKKYVTKPNAEFSFGFDLLQSSSELSTLNLRLSAHQTHKNKSEITWYLTFLSKLVTIIVDNFDYDYILIDCAPALDNLSLNALFAAKDGLIIPTNLDVAAIRGVEKVIATFFSFYKDHYKLQTQTNFLGKKNVDALPHRGILGIALNMYHKQRKIDKSIEKMVEEFFPFEDFITRIPDSVNAKIATYNVEPIHLTEEKMAIAYDSLAKEIIERCEIPYTVDELFKKNENDLLKYQEKQEELAKEQEILEEYTPIYSYDLSLEEKIAIAKTYYDEHPKKKCKKYQKIGTKED